MADRKDWITIGLYLGIGALFLTISFAFGPNSLINQYGNADLAFWAGGIFWAGFALAFLYPAYWALVIREALTLRLYRNQALGMGLLGAWVAIVFLRPLEVILSLSVLLFYWIDASILAARRSDPLLRDTLRWSKLRWVFWILVVGLLVPEMVDIVISGNFFGNTLTKDIFGTLVKIPFGLIFVSGAPLLVLVSRRSGDITLKTHMKWFGYFVLAILAAGLSQNAGQLTVTFVLFVAGAYFLYRSARSLAPLNRLKLEPEGILQQPLGVEHDA